jgi:hypothetical protein
MLTIDLAAFVGWAQAARRERDGGGGGGADAVRFDAADSTSEHKPR